MSRLLDKMIGMCDYIVEFGTGEGRLTDKIVSNMKEGGKFYTLDIVSNEKIVPIREKANALGVHMLYKYGDSRLVEIDDCDMLFIDTVGNANHLWAELYDNHKHVKNCIAIMGTEKHYYEGEDEGHLGLMSAIEKFIKDNEGWKISYIHHFGRGFTLLSRK